MTLVVRPAVRVFDTLDRWWTSANAAKTLGTLLILSYAGALVVIEINRQGWLPGPLAAVVPRNHFGAVGLAFTLVLVLEVLSLVFVLAESVANSVGKQFELLSLILLRKAFLEFSTFGEPIMWDRISGPLLQLLADAGGALLVFVGVGFFFRIQRHEPITEDEVEEQEFVAAKKLVALLILLAFVVIAVDDVHRMLTDQEPYPFFEAFYLTLIFSDILIVLISFRYSVNYIVLFRNSAFALGTVLIRLALSAPPYYNAALAVGAVLFVVGVSLAYNAFAGQIHRSGE